MGSGIDWSGLFNNLGSALAGGYKGSQPNYPGSGGSGGGGGKLAGGAGTPGSTSTPHTVSMQAPTTGPIIFPNAPTIDAGAGIGSIPMPQAPSTFHKVMGDLSSFAKGLSAGSFKDGGIVPRTGMYEVQGGEAIIPKKKVAKLHKGEKVLLPTRRPASFEGQFVGGYQDGGIIPTGAITDDQQQGFNFRTDTLWDERVPGQPTQAQKLALAMKAALGTGMRPGAAPQGDPGGGLVSPARVGATPQLPGVPRVSMQPGSGAQTPGATGATGMPMGPVGLPPAGPGQPGGPMSYASGVNLPPYQSRFLGSREFNQYATQNVLGGVTNAVLSFKQRQFDKRVQEAQADATRRIQIDQERRAQPQQQPQQGGQPAQPPGQMPANQVGQGQPGAPGQPLPEMTQDEQQTYAGLQKSNPKMAQQYLQQMQRREQKSMKALEKAQTDPTSPEYRGYMMARQGMLAQQQQQAEMQAKTAQAQAQMLDARAKFMQAQNEIDTTKAFTNMFTPLPEGQQGVGPAPATTTGTTGKAGDPPELIDRLKPGPIKQAIDNLQNDKKLNPSERAQLNIELARLPYERNLTGIAGAVNNIAKAREKGADDVGTWRNPKTGRYEEVTRSSADALSAQMGVPANFIKMSQKERDGYMGRQTQINDVQMNTSRETAAAIQYRDNPPPGDQQTKDQVLLHSLMNEAGVADLKVKIGAGGDIEIPGLSAVTEALSRQARSSSYKYLSPQAKDLFDGYQSQMGAMASYLRAINPGNRLTEQQMNLELQQLANPTWDPRDILRRQERFQNNLDQVQNGIPQLIGEQRNSDIRNRYERPLEKPASGGADTSATPASQGRPGERPVIVNGQTVGYTMDGKTMRSVGAQ